MTGRRYGRRRLTFLHLPPTEFEIQNRSNFILKLDTPACSDSCIRSMYMMLLLIHHLLLLIKLPSTNTTHTLLRSARPANYSRRLRQAVNLLSRAHNHPHSCRNSPAVNSSPRFPCLIPTISRPGAIMGHHLTLTRLLHLPLIIIVIIIHLTGDTAAVVIYIRHMDIIIHRQLMIIWEGTIRHSTHTWTGDMTPPYLYSLSIIAVDITPRHIIIIIITLLLQPTLPTK